MKRTLLGLSALVIALSVNAQSAPSCDKRLQDLSAAEMAARGAYLANNATKSLPLMDAAAKSFDDFADHCALGPMAYAGVLVYGRLSLLHRARGSASEAATAAAAAAKYAELLRKRKVDWAEIEDLVRSADLKQRAAADR